MKITEIGLSVRAGKAIARKGIRSSEELTAYIEAHPGWCHSDAYPNNIRGIGEILACEVLDKMLECGLVDEAWHDRQAFLATPEGYATLWTCVGKTRKRLNVEQL